MILTVPGYLQLFFIEYFMNSYVMCITAHMPNDLVIFYFKINPNKLIEITCGEARFCTTEH